MAIHRKYWWSLLNIIFMWKFFPNLMENKFYNSKNILQSKNGLKPIVALLLCSSLWSSWSELLCLVFFFCCCCCLFCYLHMLSEAVIALFSVDSYAVSLNKITWMQFQNDLRILLIGPRKVREFCFSFFVATLFWLVSCWLGWSSW